MIRPDKGKYPVTQGFRANPFKYGYGAFGHDGIDLGTPTGTKLFAQRDGRVETNTHPAYGKRVKIHRGTKIYYAGHLSKYAVRNGQNVTEGQLIGYSGATGNVTGPHTHWGVYVKPLGFAINPQKHLEKVNAEADNDDMYKGKTAKYWYNQWVKSQADLHRTRKRRNFFKAGYEKFKLLYENLIKRIKDALPN